MENLESAKEATDDLLVKAPEMFDGYHIKTQLYLYEKKYEDAIAFSKYASEKFPEDSDLLYDHAKALSLGKRFDDAIKTIEQAKQMKYFADSKRNFTLLEGQIFAELNNFEKAIACCEECIALESENGFDGEARFMLMNLYLAEQNHEKSLVQADEIVKNDAKDSYYFAALYYKPFCTKQLGKLEEANRLYKEANSIYRLETLKNPAAIDVYLYRAMCLKDMEEYEKAMELLDFISGLNIQLAEIHTLRADIYRAQGRQALVEEELQKAFAIKPELKPDGESKGE